MLIAAGICALLGVLFAADAIFTIVQYRRSTVRQVASRQPTPIAQLRPGVEAVVEGSAHADEGTVVYERQ